MHTKEECQRHKIPKCYMTAIRLSFHQEHTEFKYRTAHFTACYVL